MKRRSPSKGDLDAGPRPRRGGRRLRGRRGDLPVGAHRPRLLRRLARRPGRGPGRVSASPCCARTSPSSPADVCDARLMGADAVLLIVAALDGRRAGRARRPWPAGSASTPWSRCTTRPSWSGPSTPGPTSSGSTSATCPPSRSTASGPCAWRRAIPGGRGGGGRVGDPDGRRRRAGWPPPATRRCWWGSRSSAPATGRRPWPPWPATRSDAGGATGERRRLGATERGAERRLVRQDLRDHHRGRRAAGRGPRGRRRRLRVRPLAAPGGPGHGGRHRQAPAPRACSRSGSSATRRRQRVVEIANQHRPAAPSSSTATRRPRTAGGCAERVPCTIKAFPAGDRTIGRFAEFGADYLLIDGAEPRARARSSTGGWPRAWSTRAGSIVSGGLTPRQRGPGHRPPAPLRGGRVQRGGVVPGSQGPPASCAPSWPPPARPPAGWPRRRTRTARPATGGRRPRRRDPYDWR